MIISRLALVIHSPYSGRSAHLSQAITFLRQAHVELADVIAASTINDRPDSGIQWRQQGIQMVIAAGGDGLVGRLLPHVIAGSLPMGILPLGTANNVARSVGIPQNLQQAARVIAGGQERDIELGMAHLAEPTLPERRLTCTSMPSSWLFAHALTVGLNAQFARLATSPTIRKHYGKMTYLLAALEALRDYRPIEVKLSFADLAGQTRSPLSAARENVNLYCQATQVTVINTPIFLGPLQMKTPGVSLHDHLIDIVVVEDAKREDMVENIMHFIREKEPHSAAHTDWHARYPALLPAEITNIPGIHHVRARGVTMATPDGKQDVTLDGELRAFTPIEVCIANERLRLFLPASSNA